MFSVIEGIVKVLKPNGKPVLGVADGNGQFIWIGIEDIKASFPPPPYKNWQTTRFLLDQSYQPKWKAERNWQQYAHTYNPSNIIPIPSPMPAEFATEPLLAIAQMPTTPQYNQQVQNPMITQSAPQLPIVSVNNTVPPTPRLVQTIPMTPTTVNLTTTPTSIDTIAKELTKIRELLELFIKPAKFRTADEIVVEDLSEKEIIEEYGLPPDLNELPEV